MNDNLDKDLQTLLRSDAAPAPDPGMADRIVARAVAHKQLPRRAGFLDGIAAALAGIVAPFPQGLAGKAGVLAALVVIILAANTDLSAPSMQVADSGQPVLTDVEMAGYDPLDNTYLFQYDL